MDQGQAKANGNRCHALRRPLIGGAENIGIVAFRKELDFRKEFVFQLSRKLAGFVVAVPLAFWLQSYWALVGDHDRLQALATAPEAGSNHPLFWVRGGEGSGMAGRVFVSIPGHYSWTFDDPLFRILLLRGIAWSAGEPVDRFNNLIEAGIEISP